MKGRIVVCKEYGKPFEIEEYDVPTPEPGAVLLRMTQAGICGSDLHVWRGDQVNVPLPATGRVMGHEGPSRRGTEWSTLRSSPAIIATSVCGVTPTGA